MKTSSANLPEPLWRFSLRDVLGWLILASAYFAIAAALPRVAPFLDSRLPSPPALAMLTACWLLLAGYYLRRRHYGALIVHAGPAAVVLLEYPLELTHGPPYDPTPIIVFVGAVGAAFGFPVSLFKDFWRALMNGASPRMHVVVNVAGGVLLTALVCSSLRAFYLALLAPTTFYNGPALVFGAILGGWLGLYMAASSCPAIGRVRVLGLSVRALAAGGLLGGLFGPLLDWWLSEYALGYSLIPARWTPLFGLATALLIGALSWRPRSAPRSAQELIVESEPQGRERDQRLVGS